VAYFLFLLRSPVCLFINSLGYFTTLHYSLIVLVESAEQSLFSPTISAVPPAIYTTFCLLSSNDWCANA
ncbi:MAG TPA: hypothetical protein VFI70_08065, partial [Nitrososphaeraceae archaeon]|nr:hypothetical protein [Nitrososphaeraceae archaeon]